MKFPCWIDMHNNLVGDTFAELNFNLRILNVKPSRHSCQIEL